MSTAFIKVTGVMAGMFIADYFHDLSGEAAILTLLAFICYEVSLLGEFINKNYNGE